VNRSWAVALDAELVFATKKLISRDITYTSTIYEQGFGVTTVEQTDTSETGSSAALNIYAGAEFYFASEWTLRAGAFMMPTTYEKFKQTIDEVLTLRINKYGATLGIANDTEAGETNFGIIFIYGLGETVALDAYSNLNNPAYTKVDVAHYTIALFFSGTVDFAKL